MGADSRARRLEPPMPDAPALSIVVPAYNEQEVLPEFHRRLAAALEAHRPGLGGRLCE